MPALPYLVELVRRTDQTQACWSCYTEATLTRYAHMVMDIYMEGRDRPGLPKAFR
jgi:hypothetical protein